MLQKVSRGSTGFGVVGLLIVVAVVVIAGLVSWRLYDTSKSRKDNGNTTQQQPNQNGLSQGGNDSNVDTTTYLDIKELGVKFKLSADIRDATYYFNGAATSTEPSVHLSTQSLTNKSGGTCDPSKAEALGTIYKTNNLNLPTGITLKVNNTNVFQLGGSYYVYASPNSPCSSEDSLLEMQTSQIRSLKEAVKTMELNQ